MQSFTASRQGAKPGERCFSTTRSPREVSEERTAHVLLAEDDGDLRALLAQAFRSQGYQVTQCGDGPDLVSKLGANVLFGSPGPYDLVVSDILMPGATALEVLEALRECKNVPPVILITAFPSQDTRDAARRFGVAALLEKPVEVQDLLSVSEKLLAERGAGAP